MKRRRVALVLTEAAKGSRGWPGGMGQGAVMKRGRGALVWGEGVKGLRGGPARSVEETGVGRVVDVVGVLVVGVQEAARSVSRMNRRRRGYISF